MAPMSAIGIQFPHIILPRKDKIVDLQKWAVVACDQYTSEEEYWRRVEKFVGDSPSTLRLTFPEVYLEKGKDEAIIGGIVASMHSYEAENILRETATPGVVFVERTLRDKRIRRGIVLAIDLEQYEYKEGNTALIRATEATIESRIPPRLAVRRKVPIEFPHVLVLINDELDPVIRGVEEYVEKNRNDTEIYSTDLMENSGNLKGYWVDNTDVLDQLVVDLHALMGDSPLLFAVGDGNHSLATAKAWWEELKRTQPNISPTHPARYALVEVQNCQDDVIEFEPIHRLITHSDDGRAILDDLRSWLESTGQGPVQIEFSDNVSADSMGFVYNGERGCVSIGNAKKVLPVATFTDFIDPWLQSHPSVKIDYVHETTAIDRDCVAGKSGNIGFVFPAMPKSDLFKSVESEGRLPRKTFSMGASHEKRFYFEGRRIV
jgi:hypothetical protein